MRTTVKTELPGDMRVDKILIISALFLMVFLDTEPLWGDARINGPARERIMYRISPIGESEYNDLGMVDLEGSRVNVLTFRTKVLFFEDTEKIYSDPDTLLPIKVERTISGFWGKEYITEEYDQKKFTVTLRKFKKNKVLSEHITRTRGPIHNAIVLLFNMCKIEGHKIGWHFDVRMPHDEFKIEVVSIDEITIPAGTFRAYHYRSTPDKAEIWINKNNPRVLLKIQGKGIFNYVLSMKKYSLRAD